MLRLGGGPTTTDGLFEAIAVAIHGEEADEVAKVPECLARRAPASRSEPSTCVQSSNDRLALVGDSGT